MNLTVGLKALPKMVFALAGFCLLAGLGGCGDDVGFAPMDAAAPPVWSSDVTVSSCDDFATIAVGSYVIASNYWNKDVCPGTQCIEMNSSTGAFSVTQGPPPCGNNVASYPNVLYGCSYGNCSPGTILPKPVEKVTSLTSSWNFYAGGSSSDDAWNVGYDIWFCPDNNCGASGFPKGLELMIWLDYKNAHGWKNHLGTVKLAGYTWDVWSADMLVGGASDSWSYMDYILQPPMVTSVTNLDLNLFIQDAIKRGYAQSSWYLYAVQAGMEVRSGGMPFTSNSFSVTINGQTPSTVPVPSEGPSCDGGVPTVDGQLTVRDTYVTAGPLHGYGAAWTSATGGSTAMVCGSPVCTAGQTGAAGTCSPALGPSALCTSGVVSADPTYHAVAGVGFELNQDPFVPGSTSVIDGGAMSPIGAITIPNSIAVTLSRADTLGGNSSLRFQLVDVNGNIFCYGGPLNDVIPITKFNTQCWNNKGDYATSSTLFTRLDVIVPSSATTDLQFAYCIANVVVQ
jgi:Glycosyl hydrolase family 12